MVKGGEYTLDIVVKVFKDRKTIVKHFWILRKNWPTLYTCKVTTFLPIPLTILCNNAIITTSAWGKLQKLPKYPNYKIGKEGTFYEEVCSNVTGTDDGAESGCVRRTCRQWWGV